MVGIPRVFSSEVVALSSSNRFLEGATFHRCGADDWCLLRIHCVGPFVTEGDWFLSVTSSGGLE